MSLYMVSDAVALRVPDCFIQCSCLRPDNDDRLMVAEQAAYCFAVQSDVLDPNPCMMYLPVHCMQGVVDNSCSRSEASYAVILTVLMVGL